MWCRPWVTSAMARSRACPCCSMAFIFCSNKAAASSPKLDEGACVFSRTCLQASANLWPWPKFMPSSLAMPFSSCSSKVPSVRTSSTPMPRKSASCSSRPHSLRNAVRSSSGFGELASARAALTAPPWGACAPKSAATAGCCAPSVWAWLTGAPCARSHFTTCAWPRSAAQSMLRLPVASCWLSSAFRPAACSTAPMACSVWSRPKLHALWTMVRRMWSMGVSAKTAGPISFSA